jgi:hypothetical protein
LDRGALEVAPYFRMRAAEAASPFAIAGQATKVGLETFGIVAALASGKIPIAGQDRLADLRRYPRTVQKSSRECPARAGKPIAG